ncbi:hypothetical protein LB521_22965 [Mesorhizobium sp. BR-1-1-8]|uniref:hypothetical protein n=1 Tax=Mesorhizobium sp. BR-1-1-8 TaxID=2876659 RepID=UPI001CCEDAAE|nr:hypothetical protein [Mesorhizobium sp. BR-1-1-8]MBZ9984000.1 hypothetical protein [Mesorhizobium sp. BR-1-1-8]
MKDHRLPGCASAARTQQKGSKISPQKTKRNVLGRLWIYQQNQSLAIRFYLYPEANPCYLKQMARPAESKRQWISGLATTLTAIVCLFGFWRLSPGVTFTIALISLVALVIFFWLAGKAGRGD